VPVYFAYITAWAERNGRVEFRTDLYNQDGQQATADWVDPDAPPPPPQSLAP
jgi:murein L,D-transpeptidase YcbB/YkuD